MDHKEILNKLRAFMRNEGLDAFVASSTDEYLNEYVELVKNSRYFVTGFTGSTGDALITKDNAFLFVDGRYHQQADNEVDKNAVTVVKLTMNQSQNSALIDKINELSVKNPKIGIVSSKIRFSSFKSISEGLKNAEFSEYPKDPVGDFAGVENIKTDWKLRSVPAEISGISADDKLEEISSKMQDGEILVVTKLEDIAYLTNLRGDEIPFCSSFKAKALVQKGKCTVFLDVDKVTDDIKENGLAKFEFLGQEKFADYLENLPEKKLKILVSEEAVNLLTYRTLEQTGSEMVKGKTNQIEQMKSVKNKNELLHIKECFLKTDIVMSRIKTWIAQSLEYELKISEKDISDKVKVFFEEENSYGLSFEVISSSGKNTSIVHYSNPSAEKFVKADYLVLIDCGGYFEGGYATDITRTFIAGKNILPDQVKKRIYTTVLKAFLNGLNYPIDEATTGFDIDKAVRDVINSNEQKGFSFAHGTGHGVGISVHESPPRISPAEASKTRLKAGMCFTIEPGLYNDNWGGVRLENTVTVIEKDGKLKIQSLVKSSFDEALVDYSILTAQEINWFEDYQKKAIN